MIGKIADNFRVTVLTIFFISTLFLLFLLLSGCSISDSEDEESETTFAVEIAKAETKEFTHTFEESGEVVAWQEAYLVSKTAGEITAINARSGDRVRKDQVILTVDNTYQNIQLRQAEAGWEAMKNELEELEKLVENGAVPEAELRQLKAEFEQVELQKELARYGYEVTQLKAPFDGIISELMVDEGQLIGQDPIGRIVNSNKVKIRVTVTEDYISNFYRGMYVDVEVPSADFHAQGGVVSIGKAAIPESRSYLVEIEVNNPSEALLPGMFATIRVKTDPRESVTVPGTALIEGEETYIFIPYKHSTGEQTARMKQVKTGIRHDGMAEIISGLTEGDKYILRPPPGFKEDSSYTVTGGAGE